MATQVFEQMIGKTMVRVTGSEGDDEQIFESTDGHRFRFYHKQDCCESVSIEDVAGDLADLVGSPLVMAESVDSEPPAPLPGAHVDQSFTWTFYRFATAKGAVTVRWYGSSNGYYSETVDCAHTPPDGRPRQL